MAKPIEIEFTADAKKVIKEADNIGDAFDEVSDSLKDLAKDSDKATGKIEDGSKDAARAADKIGDSLDDQGDAATRFQRKVDSAFDSVSRSAKDSGDKIGDSQRDGFKRASAGLDEFKSEAGSTAKESAASFSGSFDDVGGAIQETLANAFVGLGPIGAAAGLAAAAGLGILTAQLQGDADKANELGEAIADMGQEIRDSGGDLDSVDFESKMADWGLAIEDTKDWWEIFQKSAKTGLEVIREEAAKAGVGWEEAFRGTAGSMEDSEAALDRVNALLEETTRNATTYSDAYTGALKMDSGSRDQIDALETLRDRYEENIEVQRRAQAGNEALAEAGIKTADALEAEEEALEATRDAAEAAAEQLDTAAEATRNLAEANMGADEAMLNWLDTNAQMMEDIRANGEALDMNTEAGAANRQSLIDLAGAANAHRDALIESGESTATVTSQTVAAREAFLAAADAAGYEAGVAAELADAYGLIPGNVETLVQAHGTEEAKAAVESIPEAKDTKVSVAEEGSAKAQENIESVEGVERTVKVKEEGADAVQTKINRITGKTVPITVSITNLGAIQSELDRLTAPRSVWVTVNERPGVQVP